MPNLKKITQKCLVSCHKIINSNIEKELLLKSLHVIIICICPNLKYYVMRVIFFLDGSHIQFCALLYIYIYLAWYPVQTYIFSLLHPIVQSENVTSHSRDSSPSHTIYNISWWDAGFCANLRWFGSVRVCYSLGYSYSECWMDWEKEKNHHHPLNGLDCFDCQVLMSKPSIIWANF